MAENDGEKLEAWRKSPGDGTTLFLYQKGEYVRHQGHKFVCRIGHSAHKEAEPGVGARWFDFWDLEEVSIPTEEVFFPAEEVSGKLFFAAKPVFELEEDDLPSASGQLEEVDLDRLKELVDSGECNVRFELKYPECKPIRIAQMELLGFEETEDGTVAHMLILRDMTDEEK